jgi:hypothetical protein
LNGRCRMRTLLIVGMVALGSVAVIHCAAAEVSEARRKELLAKVQVYGQEFDARMKRLGPFSKGEGKERYEAQGIEARLWDEHIGNDARKQTELMEAILLTKDDGFAHWALVELVKAFASHGKRDQLRDLLTKRCPDQLGLYSRIEDYLIIECASELKDGTLVLCGAFDRSTDKDARRTIAEALRRGFTAMRIVDADDEKLVSKVRQWYKANSASFDVNFAYLDHWTNGRSSFEDVGVLKKKPAAESRDRSGQRPPNSRP